jgi:hypothetical protein
MGERVIYTRQPRMRTVAVAVAVGRFTIAQHQLISVPPPPHFGGRKQDMTGGAHAAGQKRSKRASGSFTRCDAMMRAREYLGRWRLI